MADENGNFEFVSTPKNAEIYLDGYFQGYTPLIIHNVNPGHHEISFSLNGFHPYQKRLEVYNGENLKLNVSLKENSNGNCQLIIDSLPKYCNIVINGKKSGSTPLNIKKDLIPGNISIKCERPNYITSEKDYFVNSGLNQISFVLKPKRKGKLYGPICD